MHRKSWESKVLIQAIKDINFVNDTIIIKIRQGHSIIDLKDYTPYIYIETSAFGAPLQFSSDCVHTIIKTSNNEFRLTYNFPFVDEYYGKLHILQEIPPKSQNSEIIDIRPLIAKSYQFHTVIGEFIDNRPYSQMKCEGQTFETRTCEMRGVLHYRMKFIFSTPAYYHFPTYFMTLCARAPPFSPSEDHLIFEPLVTNEIFDEDVDILENRTSFVFARFFNSMMLWHILFDFTIPAIFTMNQIGDPNAVLYLKDNQHNTFFEFVSVLSKHPIINLKRFSDSVYFKRVFVGIKKLESNPNRYRRLDEMFRFSYNFNESTAPNLRDLVLKYFSLPRPIIKHDNPQIYVISRVGNREIINEKEMSDYIEDTCLYCSVRRVDFQYFSIERQIQLISEASVIVGAHGSGLSHSLWQQPCDENYSTVMLEILPYKYSCRDWYHTAARVARVKYFSFMNTGKILPRFNDPQDAERAKTCWKHSNKCYEIQCHDLLKDQTTVIEMDEFKKKWNQIQQILDQNRMIYLKSLKLPSHDR